MIRLDIKNRTMDNDGQEYLLTKRTTNVWEHRASYKVFHYQMANNSLITVVDRRLGFSISELEHLHN